MHIRHTLRSLLRRQPVDPSIDPRERVVFFPTAAHFDSAKDVWHVPIHGRIYQPTEFSRIRRAALWFVKSLLSRRARKNPLDMALFQERAGAFFADNERWERIQIQLGSSIFKLKRSSANGHFHAALQLPAAQVAAWLAASPGQHTPNVETHQDTAPWLSFRALTPTTDGRQFDGRALLLPPQGLSIISDIDDTIKITQVASRRSMLRNTFLKDFTSVPHMPELYQNWAAKEGGVAFHYVSASPWHLYPFLAEFLRAQRFPAGTFHLRDFRLMPVDLHRTLRRSRSIKLRHARTLLERFPRRRFLLIGDSGESDPAIYATLCRAFPGQVGKIYIRNVTQEDATAFRWQKVFRQIPSDRWQVFSRPEELM